MATDLSSQNSLPHVEEITVGTSWEVVTLPPGCSRADVHFVTNSGVFSFESGTPSVEAPVSADSWFVVWEAPLQIGRRDQTVQLKASSAGTTVYLRVV